MQLALPLLHELQAAKEGGGRRDLLGTLFLQPGLDSAAVSGEGEKSKRFC